MLDVRAGRGADININPFMLMGKIRLKLSTERSEPAIYINIVNLKSKNIRKQFKFNSDKVLKY